MIPLLFRKTRTIVISIQYHKGHHLNKFVCSYGGASKFLELDTLASSKLKITIVCRQRLLLRRESMDMSSLKFNFRNCGGLTRTVYKHLMYGLQQSKTMQQVISSTICPPVLWKIKDVVVRLRLWFLCCDNNYMSCTICNQYITKPIPEHTKQQNKILGKYQITLSTCP